MPLTSASPCAESSLSCDSKLTSDTDSAEGSNSLSLSFGDAAFLIRFLQSVNGYLIMDQFRGLFLPLISEATFYDIGTKLVTGDYFSKHHYLNCCLYQT